MTREQAIKSIPETKVIGKCLDCQVEIRAIIDPSPLCRRCYAVKLTGAR